MKKMNVAKRFGAGVALVSASAASFAAVPADLTSALDTGKADASTVALGVLLIVVAIMAFRWIRKAL